MVGCPSPNLWRTPMKVLLIVAAVAAAALMAKPCNAQVADSSLITSVHMGAAYMQGMITGSAARMDEGDYAFRPAPEVRSFAELIRHVADSNYDFCALMTGEKRPAIRVAETAKTKSEIQAALAESFKYCEPALAAINGPRGREIVKFQSRMMPASSVMNFRNYHGLLHYGNTIVYLRLKGKIPPSTEP